MVLLLGIALLAPLLAGAQGEAAQKAARVRARICLAVDDARRIAPSDLPALVDSLVKHLPPQGQIVGDLEPVQQELLKLIKIAQEKSALEGVAALGKWGAGLTRRNDTLRASFLLYDLESSLLLTSEEGDRPWALDSGFVAQWREAASCAQANEQAVSIQQFAAKLLQRGWLREYVLGSNPAVLMAVQDLGGRADSRAGEGGSELLGRRLRRRWPVGARTVRRDRADLRAAGTPGAPRVSRRPR